MNFKRIVCLVLVIVTLLGILASGIALLVSAEAPTTAPTQSTEPAQSTGDNTPQDMKNGDKIVIFVLGAIVPCVIFLVMIIRTVWKKN